jgi:hypothetical protein
LLHSLCFDRDCRHHPQQQIQEVDLLRAVF